MEDYRDRLRKFMHKKKIKPSYFVENKMFTNGHVNRLIQKKIHFGVDKLEIILNHFQQLNPKWLITGKGTMEDTQKDVASENLSSDVELLKKLDELTEKNKEYKKQIFELRYIIKLQRKNKDCF